MALCFMECSRNTEQVAPLDCLINIRVFFVRAREYVPHRKLVGVSLEHIIASW